MTRCADCGRRARDLVNYGTGNLAIHLCPASRLDKCKTRRAKLKMIRSVLQPRAVKVLSRRIHTSRGK